MTVRVPAAASTLKIADVLAKAGVIRGPAVFEMYLKLEGGGPLLPGTYKPGALISAFETPGANNPTSAHLSIQPKA